MIVLATGAGVVTNVTQLDCSTYTVQGYVPQSDPFEVNSTTVVLQLKAGVISACNGSFPAASQLVTVDHRYDMCSLLAWDTFRVLRSFITLRCIV